MGRKGRALIGPQVGLGPAVEDIDDVLKEEREDQWWHCLKGDCPITLEPLASLDVPPFGLESDGTTHYFDPVALASYITRRAVFENPLNRKAISREDCNRLDDHIKTYVSCTRNFRVADSLDLKSAIRDRVVSSNTDRSATSRRREATAALQNLFSFPSIQAAESLSAMRSDGNFTVVDDDMQRHIEAEAIAAMQAALEAENARVGGAVPEASTSNFPLLSEDAMLAGERLNSTCVEHGGYASVVQAMADEANREARKQAAEEAARHAAAKEAAARRDAAMREAKSKALEMDRMQESMQAEAARRSAEKLAEKRKQVEDAKAESLRSAVLEKTAEAEKREREERAVAAKRAEEEQREAHEDLEEKQKRQEEERLVAEERKKEREAEKKRKQKEKKRLEKEKAAAEQAKKELEEAKSASTTKCILCGEGILGQKFFDFMGEKFCSTACVKKKRAGSSS